MSRVCKNLEIRNKHGLHARAAALFVRTINKFSSRVNVSKDGVTSDGRSIMGILTLGASQGSKIKIEAVGEDAEKAVRAIEKLVENRFNEPE
jgi:phosphocarrier protein